jgi:[ribosomal protein S5]-alanine N-acetyltransferase
VSAFLFMETERLFLKLYEKKDKEYFVKLATDADVMKYVDRGVLTPEQSESLWQKLVKDFYAQGVDTIWAVLAKEDSRYIGHAAIGPRPEKSEDWEISYLLKGDEWNKGFATEIVRGIIDYGFKDLNLPEVFATVKPANKNSIRVLKKAGMSFLSQELDVGGEFSIYSAKKN